MKADSGANGCQSCGRTDRQVKHWIMCDQCENWYCLQCAKIRPEDLPLYDDQNPEHREFVCNDCQGGGESIEESEASEDEFMD